MHVTVELNPLWIDDAEEGRLIAEALKRRIENTWRIRLLNIEENVSYYRIYYGYEPAEKYPLQSLKDAFLQYCPFEGFGKILHSMGFWEYVDIYLYLELDEQGLPIWYMTFTLYYNEYFNAIANQRHLLSLKELTSYAEPVQSSPEASSSILYMAVSRTDKQFRFTNFQTVPEEMNVTLYTDFHFYSFIKDIKGESVDDLSVSFLLSPVDISYAIPLLAPLGIMATIIVISSIIIMRTKGKSRRIQTIN